MLARKGTSFRSLLLIHGFLLWIVLSSDFLPLRSMNATDSTQSYDDLRVPMRDGVTLSTNVFLPAGEGPFPVLLIRTPYNAALISDPGQWTGRGYALVGQDVRGRFRSGGEDTPWFREKEDGEDTLEWLSQQPWCNGKVAMYGGSYLGATQTAASRSGHPALQCITPALIGAECYHWTYWGGALRYGRIARWILRAPEGLDQEKINENLRLSESDVIARGKQLPHWREILNHPTNDEFWKKDSFSEEVSKIQAPAFVRTGWFDIFVADVFDLYNGIRNHAGSRRAREGTRIIVGPWPHDINQTKVGDVDFGEGGKILDLFEQELLYIDHFTKNDREAPIPAAPIRIFVMGANEWRDEFEWPLARTHWTKFYLASEGKANTAKGNGRLAEAPSGDADGFDYDPANPVPTLGGAWDFTNIGLKDQRELEQRSDVLVYTSKVLAAAMEVTGPVQAELYISSSAPDTDFTVKLVDVAPDGSALGVTDGIVRTRYRNGVAAGELLQAGAVCQLTIHCTPTSYLFKKGHRIRVHVSSSNFPVFSRNLNTGEPCGQEISAGCIARQIVHHTLQYPSSITLPVIPQ